MQKFDEMCITTYRDDMQQAKLANQGTPGIWVSYIESHPTCAYWAFNPKTKQIILTQDMTFLHKSYGEYSKVEKPVLVTTSYEGLDDEEKLEKVPIISSNNNNNNSNFTDSENNIDNGNYWNPQTP